MALKIAMLTTFYPPYNFGGDGTGVHRLSMGLADRGHEVTVVHDRDAYIAIAGAVPRLGRGRSAHRGDRPQIAPRQAVDATCSPTGRPVAHARQLSDLLDGGGFDVIWFHNSPWSAAPACCATAKRSSSTRPTSIGGLRNPCAVAGSTNAFCETPHCLSCTVRHISARRSRGAAPACSRAKPDTSTLSSPRAVLRAGTSTSLRLPAGDGNHLLFPAGHRAAGRDRAAPPASLFPVRRQAGEDLRRAGHHSGVSPVEDGPDLSDRRHGRI